MHKLTSLQYNPHALQLSSLLSPRRQSGVWVVPQLEHFNLAPPGVGSPLGPLMSAGLRFVAVAPGRLGGRMVGVAVLTQTVRDCRLWPEGPEGEELVMDL